MNEKMNVTFTIMIKVVNLSVLMDILELFQSNCPNKNVSLK